MTWYVALGCWLVALALYLVLRRLPQDPDFVPLPSEGPTNRDRARTLRTSR